MNIIELIDARKSKPKGKIEKKDISMGRVMAAAKKVKAGPDRIAKAHGKFLNRFPMGSKIPGRVN